jgi:hypothetical protein
MIGLEALERRLDLVEKAVADLQQRLPGATVQSDWLKKVIGSISDEPAFLEALDHARALRQADRPQDQPGDRP